MKQLDAILLDQRPGPFRLWVAHNRAHRMAVRTRLLDHFLSDKARGPGHHNHGASNSMRPPTSVFLTSNSGVKITISASLRGSTLPLWPARLNARAGFKLAMRTASTNDTPADCTTFLTIAIIVDTLPTSADPSGIIPTRSRTTPRVPPT